MAGPIELRFKFCPNHHPGNPFRKLRSISVDLKGVTTHRDLTSRLNEVFKNEYTENGKLFRFQLQPGDDTVSFHAPTKDDEPCSQDLSLATLRTEYASQGRGLDRSTGDIVFLHINFKDKTNSLPKSPQSPKDYNPLWRPKKRSNTGRAPTPKTSPQKRKAVALAQKFSILALPKHILKFRFCQFDEFEHEDILEIDVTECESWEEIKNAFWQQMEGDVTDFFPVGASLHFHHRVWDGYVRDRRRVCAGGERQHVMLDGEEGLDVETFKVMYCWVGEGEWHRFGTDVNRERLLSVHFDLPRPSPRVKQEPVSPGRRRIASGAGSLSRREGRAPGNSISPQQRSQRSGSRARTPSDPPSVGGSQKRGSAGSRPGSRRATASPYTPSNPASPLNSSLGGSQRSRSLPSSSRPRSRQATGSPRPPHGLPYVSLRGQGSGSRQGTGSGRSPGNSTSPQNSVSSRGQRGGSAPRTPGSRPGSRQGTGSPRTPYDSTPPDSSGLRGQRNGSVPRASGSRASSGRRPTSSRGAPSPGEDQLLDQDGFSDVEPEDAEPNEDAVEEAEPSPTLETERPEDENTLEELHKESRKRKASDADLSQPSKAAKFLDLDDGRRYVRIGKLNATQEAEEPGDPTDSPTMVDILVAVIHPRGARGSGESSVQYLSVNTWNINGSRIGAYQNASEVNLRRVTLQVDPFWAPKWNPRKPELLTQAILTWAFTRFHQKKTNASNAPKEAPVRVEHSLHPFDGTLNPDVDNNEDEEIDVVITFVNNLAKTPLGLPEHILAALDNAETCGTFKSYILDNVVSDTYGTLDHMLHADDSGFNYWGDLNIWVLPHGAGKVMCEWQDDGSFAEEFLDAVTVQAFGKRLLMVILNLQICPQRHSDIESNQGGVDLDRTLQQLKSKHIGADEVEETYLVHFEQATQAGTAGSKTTKAHDGKTPGTAVERRSESDGDDIIVPVVKRRVSKSSKMRRDYRFKVQDEDEDDGDEDEDIDGPTENGEESLGADEEVEDEEAPDNEGKPDLTHSDDDHPLIRIGVWDGHDDAEPTQDGNIAMDIVIVAEVKAEKEINYYAVHSWFVNGISIGHFERSKRVTNVAEMVKGYTPDRAFAGLKSQKKIRERLIQLLNDTDTSEVSLDAYNHLEDEEKDDNILIQPPTTPQPTDGAFPPASKAKGKTTQTSKSKKKKPDDDIALVVYFANNVAREDLPLDLNRQLDLSPGETFENFSKWLLDGQGDYKGIRRGLENEVDKGGWNYNVEYEVFVLPQQGAKRDGKMWNWKKNSARRVGTFLNAAMEGVYGRELYVEVQLNPHRDSERLNSERERRFQRDPEFVRRVRKATWDRIERGRRGGEGETGTGAKKLKAGKSRERLSGEKEVVAGRTGSKATSKGKESKRKVTGKNAQGDEV
ncbi:uncharacterized protein MYCFIDRAFT_77216 [Pseudocercospora fijiensis CIRAD86]|uniref:Uncharacterized protein n=1 Tax=Pseudocercospora fijiensis (strain CIRAD86) TaxID=383855 RepID=M3A7C8_PSEFD|nr:uncharacterized protein MYCFIDRAFT_77216 [Pseudocercospora fijiensis CIRAD86]EME86994.1 hypothetical protein MYCFIDRAFT_77216 [Pseudocercospora fijiensis CIRAD86]